MDAYPDMSAARSVSVELDTSMAVDFDDRSREMQDIATRSELDDTTATIGASRFRNPSFVSRHTHRIFKKYLTLGTRE